MDPCGLKAYSFLGRIPADAIMTVSIPFPKRFVHWGNPSSDCESITIQLSKVIHQEDNHYYNVL